jgi:hypothetical protein
MGPGAPKRFVECPLPVEEQQQAVLEIAPRGTSRDDLERRLASAGIEFSRGGNGSIYYLTVWNRPNGEHWHMNVALLFDSAGTLYHARAANASTGLAVETESPQENLTQPP